MKRRAFILTLILVAGLGFSRAQESPSPGAAAEDYRLGRGDLIEISVFGVEDFKYSVRIGSSGAITLPYVGEVQATGKSPLELADDLRAVMAGSLFRDPHVIVRVLEYHSTPVVILGAVAKPGTYQMGAGQLKLIDALAEAGGVTPNAGEQVLIQRSHEGEAGRDPETIQISLHDLFNRGVTSLNIPLHGGDLINVPPAPKVEEKSFFVIGEVFRPGVFNLPGEERLYLTQAVAAAGGPLKTAKVSKGILVRYGEDGQRQEISINFQKMLEGKDPDILVQARDVIFIPGSNIKTIGYGLLGVIPGAVSQTATSGVIR